MAHTVGLPHLGGKVGWLVHVSQEGSKYPKYQGFRYQKPFRVWNLGRKTLPYLAIWILRGVRLQGALLPRDSETP